MSWQDSLNQFGLAGTPPPAQQTPLNLSNDYAQGSINAGYINGVVTGSLSVGKAPNTDNAVYINSQGIYAGSTVFADAPFSVDMKGNVRSQTSSTGTGIVLNPNSPGAGFPGGEIDFYSGGVLVSYMFVNGNTVLLADTQGDYFKLDETGKGAEMNAQDNAVISVGGGNSPSIQLNTVGMGFWGATPVNKPAVIGSRDDNDALASLLSALASYGLVLDNSF